MEIDLKTFLADDFNRVQAFPNFIPDFCIPDYQLLDVVQAANFACRGHAICGRNNFIHDRCQQISLVAFGNCCCVCSHDGCSALAVLTLAITMFSVLYRFQE